MGEWQINNLGCAQLRQKYPKNKVWLFVQKSWEKNVYEPRVVPRKNCDWFK
jgi:hypothetical protein